MNNSFARARRAWKERDPAQYQDLAKLQTDLGVDYLTLNVDGTQQVSVKTEEMLEFLPELIPAIQEATSTPIAFDNPNVEYHQVALAHYDRSKSPAPILNSVAASRNRLDEMIELVKEYDTLVIVMASERFDGESGSAQCLDPQDSHDTAKRFVERLVSEAGRTPDQIIIDTGLAPVGADTYGLVNIGLDAMRLIHEDPDLAGVHLSVGLSNFSWGTPKALQRDIECAYLSLAMEVGLDFALANPEKKPEPFEQDHPLVGKLGEALELGRRRDGESTEDAGFRQAQAILELCKIER
jgi:5-methyltetrahydrofolate--homocysteine methyltransferase